MSDLENILKRVEEISEKFGQDLKKTTNLEEWEELRIKYLGRKGKISDLFGRLGQLPNEDKAEAGKSINKLKSKLESQIKNLKENLQKKAQASRLEKESIDVTLPGRRKGYGRRHVLTQVSKKIEESFNRMGFSTALGPEIETEYHNFEALNMPKLHPARDEWDSFYLDEEHLLRTHTSPVQIRVMESQKPPVKVICPGKCFRRDTPDATHFPVFHQVELLWVEEGLSLANLKYIIELFVEDFFGEKFEMRFAADYFPFTEPSAQVHIKRPKSEEWLEIMGAGMVDPAVLKAVDYDPEKYQGFALGLGIERMAMLKYDIKDIRNFYRNDLRFLKQF